MHNLQHKPYELVYMHPSSTCPCFVSFPHTLQQQLADFHPTAADSELPNKPHTPHRQGPDSIQLQPCNSSRPPCFLIQIKVPKLYTCLLYKISFTACAATLKSQIGPSTTAGQATQQSVQAQLDHQTIQYILTQPTISVAITAAPC
jgi:hypothetical protein